MQIFEIVPTKEYFAGCAIVAADNKNVAINIWKQAEEQNDNLWFDGKCWCMERPELKTDIDVPKVIIDTLVDTTNW